MSIGDVFWFIGDKLSDTKDFVDDIMIDIECAAIDVKYKAEEIATGSVEIGKEVLNIASGQFLAEAANDIVNDANIRLNALNKENDSIVTMTNEKIKMAEAGYGEIIRKLEYQRNNIHQNILCPYIDIMDKMIYDARYVGNAFEIKNIDFDIDTIEQQYQSSHGTSELSFIERFSPLVGVVSKIAQGVRIEEEIDKAKEERERLRSEQAKIDSKCTVVNEITEFMKSAFYTVESLEKQAQIKITFLKRIIDEKGYIVKNYNDNDITKIRNCTNTVILLNKITNLQLINEKGIINPVYKKYIEEQLGR